MEMEQIKAASGRVKPGVEKNFCTDSIKGTALSPNLSNSDTLGGVGGKFSNCNTVPAKRMVHKTEMSPK
jgi:hypothetical protein